MSVIRNATRPLKGVSVAAIRQRSWRRSISSEAEQLPLSGIRVLDMTRVLAGVSYENPLQKLAWFTKNVLSHTAHKSLEI